MKKKVINKIISFILVVSVFICATCAMPTVEADAAVSARKLLSSALKVMKSYDKITYKYDMSRNSDGKFERWSSISMSDRAINYGFTETNGSCWEEYQKGKYTYRRRLLSNKWDIYKDDYELISTKNDLEYMLGHLKKAKIVSISTSSYTISAVPNDSSDDIKSVRIVIDKKKKCVTGIREIYKTYRCGYYGSSDTFLVRNQVDRLTHISYGRGRLHMPAGM